MCSSFYAIKTPPKYPINSIITALTQFCKYTLNHKDLKNNNNKYCFITWHLYIFLLPFFVVVIIL